MQTPLSLFRNLFPWLCLLVGGAALATPADKNQARPMLLRLPYTSALAGYQGYTDQTVQPWREANDRVGRLGGWRVYAKEAATGQSVPITPPGVGHHEGGKQ